MFISASNCIYQQMHLLLKANAFQKRLLRELSLKVDLLTLDIFQVALFDRFR